MGERDNGAANIGNARFYHMNALNYAEGRDRLSEEQLAELKEMFGG